MASTIQVRVDNKLKEEADSLFKDLGTDTTSAIRMFLTQAVANNGFPFEIKRKNVNPFLPMSEEEIIKKIENSKRQVEYGETRDAECIVADMRKENGL